MARWQETSKTPPEGKVVLDSGKEFRARAAFLGGWKCDGETAATGDGLARKLERKYAGKDKKKSGGGFFDPDSWRLFG
jgi:hypothetical protein